MIVSGDTGEPARKSIALVGCLWKGIEGSHLNVQHGELRATTARYASLY